MVYFTLCLLCILSGGHRTGRVIVSCHFSTRMATIPEYYRDKIVFITGATGFIGKVLVEKLLRSCPQVQAIYCLTRSKQGEAASDRLSRMLSEPVSCQVNILCCYSLCFVVHDLISKSCLME